MSAAGSAVVSGSSYFVVAGLICTIPGGIIMTSRTINAINRH
jgi:hypothetical protein